MSRSSLYIKALRELGPRKIGLYALYQLGLRSGHIRRTTADAQQVLDQQPQAFSFHPVFILPESDVIIKTLGDDGQKRLLAEADEIVSGKLRLFGGEPVSLDLAPSGPLAHWTEWEQGDPQQDIKLTWEPARFGWAYTLARAYHLSRKPRYAAAFWRYFKTFQDANPPYQGPNWASAQEAALRLMAFVFALQVFADDPESTPERKEALAKAIAAHAARIPPTLVYARAQNNNHLLTEAAGMYTASCALPYHSEALRWRNLGWRWFNQGIQEQIGADGTYMQHSTNYQRLALQAALWMTRLVCARSQNFPPGTVERLAAATRWLAALLDPDSGQVPNLGPNDGAYILPLAVCPFNDYRPVLAAAGASFLGKRLFDAGLWDEMALWLVDSGVLSATDDHPPHHKLTGEGAPHILKNDRSWAYLRIAHFTDRPGHADQLHLDLWQCGENIAQDPGTYLYNAPPPWDNALTHTTVHNTLTVNQQEQMTAAGRFLYVDWAQAEVLDSIRGEDGAYTHLVARHDGYRRLGVMHQRAVSATPGNWLIEDNLLPVKAPPAQSISQFSISLNWLLQDYPWEAENISEGQFRIKLDAPHGRIVLDISAENGETQKPKDAQLQLVRAGESVYGAADVSTTWGWSSPTYGVKMPALAVRFTVDSPLPLKLVSKWALPAK